MSSYLTPVSILSVVNGNVIIFSNTAAFIFNILPAVCQSLKCIPTAPIAFSNASLCHQYHLMQLCRRRIGPQDSTKKKETLCENPELFLFVHVSLKVMKQLLHLFSGTPLASHGYAM